MFEIILKILILSNNFPYVAGLKFLINDILIGKRNTELFFLSSSEENGIEVANVIFRDSIVSVNVFKDKNVMLQYKNMGEGNRITVHIPSSWRKGNITDIESKIEKVLFIAQAGYDSLIKKDIYKRIDVNEYLQLSVMESKIILLVGKGHHTSEISKILDRSEKTIGTHCRNASRKMGMENRVEFYKYAKFIANCSSNEINTLCV